MAHMSITGASTLSVTASFIKNNHSHETKLTQATNQKTLEDALAGLAVKHDQKNESTQLSQDTFTITRTDGDPYILYNENPALNEKAKALAERLDGPILPANDNHFFYQGGMRDFLHAGLLTNPDFLDMTESMSDEELQDLAKTIKAMALPATENFTSFNEADRTYKDKVAEFVNLLQKSSSTDRATMLKQSAIYAEQVDNTHLETFRGATLGQDASLFNKLKQYRDDTSANDLHNYISAVVASEDPVALTDQLSQMSEQTQHGLLNVYGLDQNLGQRLSKLAGPGGDRVPNKLICSLGEMVDSVKNSLFSDASFGFARTGDEALLKDNEQSSSRDFAFDSVSSMITMLEQYDFSDEQLETMGNDLNALSNPEKRAYIEITTTGLDSMLHAKVSDNVNKKNFDEALAIVDELRSNKNVISLVNRAQYHDVTLIERPDIEEGLTVVALEGADVFKNPTRAIRESRTLLGAVSDKVNMVEGHSVKGHESENLYSAKSFDIYKQDAGNLVNTLVAFESMRGDSTANEKMSLNEFTGALSKMHSGIRDEALQRVNDEMISGTFQNKVTENTQFAFLSNLVQQMVFETHQDFAESSNQML